jgi:hypothetical protein
MLKFNKNITEKKVISMSIISAFYPRHPRNGMSSWNWNPNLIWTQMKKTCLMLRIESMQKNSWRHWMIGKWMDVRMLMQKIPLTGLWMALLMDLRMQTIRLRDDRMNYSCYNCHWHYYGSRYWSYFWNYCNYYNYLYYE